MPPNPYELNISGLGSPSEAHEVLKDQVFYIGVLSTYKDQDQNDMLFHKPLVMSIVDSWFKANVSRFDFLEGSLSGGTVIGLRTGMNSQGLDGLLGAASSCVLDPLSPDTHFMYFRPTGNDELELCFTEPDSEIYVAIVVHGHEMILVASNKPINPSVLGCNNLEIESPTKYRDKAFVVFNPEAPHKVAGNRTLNLTKLRRRVDAWMFAKIHTAHLEVPFKIHHYLYRTLTHQEL